MADLECADRPTRPACLRVGAGVKTKEAEMALGADESWALGEAERVAEKYIPEHVWEGLGWAARMRAAAPIYDAIVAAMSEQ